MSSDRSLAYNNRSKVEKKIESLNQELANLRNSNTEGCNDSKIKEKEKEYNELKRKDSILTKIISDIDNLRSAMESKLSSLRSHLSSVESAFTSFCNSLNSTYDEIQTLISKADKAYSLGEKAFYHLALNDYNNCSNCAALTITNIDCLSSSSETQRRQEREISSEGQNMMRNASRINEMMQSEVMRNSYTIIKELYSYNNNYSKHLERVSECLSSAYSCLREYMNVI